MDCKKAELYMTAMIDNELHVKDSFEIIEHMELCLECKTKWELSEETRSKLKHFVGSVTASRDLRKKIYKNLDTETKIVFLKPALIAACAAFLVGLGIFINMFFVRVPTLPELHMANIQLVSSDINLLSEHVGAPLTKEQFLRFERANYKPQGASSVKRFFNGEFNLISLMNKQGEKISLCLLPESYKVDNCHTVKIRGTEFKCGRDGNCHFAYWKQRGKTFALVSNKLTSEEMIDFALPMV